MSENLTYILIHSPLVGPLTWQLVHQELAKRGLNALVPPLRDQPHSHLPFWQQHARSLAKSLTTIPQNERLVLVAHSGAGPLLPIISHTLAHSIAAYVFVDAGIPRHQASRIDLMRLQDPSWAQQFHQSLQQGERFPGWQEEDLRAVIPDDGLREQMVAEINPRSLQFFTEPIPVFAHWPDAPCVYIKFSSSYEWDFRQAREAHWLVREVQAGHFHMLVDPVLVTGMIIETIQELGEYKAD